MEEVNEFKFRIPWVLKNAAKANLCSFNVNYECGNDGKISAKVTVTRHKDGAKLKARINNGSIDAFKINSFLQG